MSIDHIVWAVPNLDEGIALFKKKTGIEPVFGGYHTTQGTKNALVKIGPSCYFEILAPDPDSQILSKRWMGIDIIKKPRITRWAFKADHLEEQAKHLSGYDKNLGQLITGQRKTTTGQLIKWKMTVPHHAPMIDIAPFFIDWSESSSHPSDQLPETDLSIDCIDLSSEQAELIRRLLNQLSVTGYSVLQGAEQISISLNSPNGRVRFE